MKEKGEIQFEGDLSDIYVVEERGKNYKNPARKSPVKIPRKLPRT